MVYRIYTERKEGFADEAAALRSDARSLLGVNRLEDVRILYRYEVDGIDEARLEDCMQKVFAADQTVRAADSLEALTGFAVDENGFACDPEDGSRTDAFVFVSEPIPDRPDRQADSAAYAIQMACGCERPSVSSAKVYVLCGALMPADTDAIIRYVKGPAQAADTPAERHETSAAEMEPDEEKVLEGFTEMTEAEMRGCVSAMELAMDEADLALCAEYFRDSEQRDPTMTELRVIDAYRSEQVRHQTFNTVIDSVTFNDPLLEKAYKDYLAVRKSLGKKSPVTVADIAGIVARSMKRQGRLEKLYETEDNKACGLMINVEVDGENEPWLLLFSSAATDSLTESDPYAGAAACMGECMGDILSGRTYAYAVMRLSGAGDPRQSLSETIPGRHSQRTIVKYAAAGASEYVNLSGVCAGNVDEIYHPGYAGMRMEAGAAMAAVPSVNIRRERPEPGDIVMLLGGPEGACGDGAFAGDGLQQRKLQRFFRNPRAVRMIKRCSGFGAGGVCTAIGGLADGIDIDLDAIPGAGDGTGSSLLATGGTPEWAACVIAAENERVFGIYAADENLRCVRAAEVTEEPRLVMHRGDSKAADISREFLKSKGAERHIDIVAAVPGDWENSCMYSTGMSFADGMRRVASGLNTCSGRGLAELFDYTAGSGSVMLPYGGINGITPAQAMVQKLPLDRGTTGDCSLMAWGCNPFIMSSSPYHGAYLAVVESVSKLIASGASLGDVYLMMQQHFETPGPDGKGWGDPLAAVLGAFEAQLDLGIAPAGSKEFFTESNGDTGVPSTLVSFAVTMGKTESMISPEFKEAGHRAVLLKPKTAVGPDGSSTGLPDPESLKKVWETAEDMLTSGVAVAAYAPGMGGVAEAVMKMCYGNGIGFSFESVDPEKLFVYSYGSIILELVEEVEVAARHFDSDLLGYTTEERAIACGPEKVTLTGLLALYEGALESVFPAVAAGMPGAVNNVEYKVRSWQTPLYKRAEPKVLIPVFPGTTGEYDLIRAMREAGATPETMVIKDRTADDMKRSVEVFASALRDAQMVALPGGGSATGDTAAYMDMFFRREAVAAGIAELLEKQEGLICGLGDGFGALLKLGLVPCGKITDIDEDSPFLAPNMIGSHRSKMARVRIASNKSPWLRSCRVGETYSVPVSCEAGRLIAPDDLLKKLTISGQIAVQYVDLEGNATSDIRFNPCGSVMAVESLTSPDGRVIGRMGLAERSVDGLYRNAECRLLTDMFRNAVNYFK